MKYSPSQRASNFLAILEIPGILCSSKVRYRAQKIRHSSLSWARATQSTPAHSSLPRTNLILSSIYISHPFSPALSQSRYFTSQCVPISYLVTKNIYPKLKCFPQSYPNAAILPQIRQQPLPFTSFPIHCSVFILTPGAVIHNLLRTQWGNPHMRA
jgi:hypothetical protein